METKGFDRKRKGEEGRLGMINRLNYFIFVYENITMKTVLYIQLIYPDEVEVELQEILELS